MEWQAITDETMRMRQSLSSAKDLRPLGDADFTIRPSVADAVSRYTRGRCMDFAVRMAQADTSLRLAGFFLGESLSHAFLVTDEGKSFSPSTACLEISGAWVLRELRHFHRGDGPIRPRFLDVAQVLEDMAGNVANGADFDDHDVVLSVAGCLPHLRHLVAEPFRAENPESALVRLEAISGSKFTDPSFSVERPRPRR